MEIQGAIFDMDGTLLDSMHIWETLGEDYLKSIGIVPKGDIRGTLNTMTTDESVEFFITHYGISKTKEEITSELNYMIEDFYCNKAELKRGASEFLLCLNKKGVKMCIATATPKKLSEAALKRCGVLSLFEDILSCDDFGSKREGRIFSEALLRLNTNKSETIVFEDAKYAVNRAKEMGFFVCGVYDKWENETDAVRKKADYFITDYEKEREKLLYF